MKKLLILCFFIFTASVHAEQSITIGGLSYHLFDKTHLDEKGPEPWNYWHRAFIYTQDGQSLGYFKNSYNDDSYLLTQRVYEHRLLDRVLFSLDAGATYGYRECLKKLMKPKLSEGKKLCPNLAPALNYETKQGHIVTIWQFNAIAAFFRFNL